MEGSGDHEARSEQSLMRSLAPYLGAILAVAAVTAAGFIIAFTNRRLPDPPPRQRDRVTATTETPGSPDPADTTTTTITRLAGVRWNVPNGPNDTRRGRIVAGMIGERGVTPENPWVVLVPKQLPEWDGAPMPVRAELQIRTSGYWTGRRAWLFLFAEGDTRPPLITGDQPLDPDGLSLMVVRFETEPESRSCLEGLEVPEITVRGVPACLDDFGQLVWEESDTLVTATWRSGSVDEVASWLDTWEVISSTDEVTAA